MNSSNIPRATGLLVIEARNSNPNGDPDRESDPRTRAHDMRGIISDVSFKRKLRDLVSAKDGPVWQELSSKLVLRAEDHHILIESGRDTKAVSKEQTEGKFIDKYWDARLFGNTNLEEGADNFIRTGVVQFGIGVSVAPIRIQRDTNTIKAGVQEGKDRGMAPLGFRIVEHGLYVMPFIVNPSAAHKSGCRKADMDLFLRLIPYAYPHNPSRVRPFVEVRHAWYVEHKSQLGSCSDFAIIDALTPHRNPPADKPSTSIDDYKPLPTALPEELQMRLNPLRDLCAEAYSA